jgi:pilus assembly protein CpaB
MNAARLIVLGVAVLAGGVAAYLAAGVGDGPPAPAPVKAVAPMKTTDVLVAAAEVQMGSIVGARELRWQVWPADATTAGMITKTEQPSALQDLTGAISRTSLMSGEPVRKERLIKSGEGGVMSALLPTGARAIAITIDNRGANSAGGFILPNDRVDVVRTFRDEAASKAQGADVILSETLLRNIRVLAIGQNIQERNGEKVVVGETATLELDPRQVEVVLLAQRLGQLSLALRSLQDAGKPEDQIVRNEDTSLTIVRYGTSAQR